MTKIPDEFVEELRKTVDIVDVISEYVPLRRAGRSYMGLCPFHSEKSPSFSVSPDRQLYHCFGCGAGGTAIRFLMEIDGLTFTESVIKLADRVNLSLPISVVPESLGERPRDGMQALIEAHELASKYYNYILMNSAAGVQALTYLEARGISRQTMVEFQLGAAPDAEDALVQFLKKRGYDAQTIVDAGLGIHLGSKLVDRFRQRVMVPIYNGQGKVVSFGGRTLVADGKPKYLNSPETALFHKSSILFNLHRAKQEARKMRTFVLMEGYMDVISAWQAGVTNVVATMGTSLTEDHAKLLRRYADKVVLAYDGDSAGRKATKRAIDLAAKHKLNVRVAMFPGGQDPDDFIRTHGAKAFVRQVQQRPITQLQFLLDDLKDNAQLETMAGRTDFIRQSLTILGERGTPIEQDAVLRNFSQEFQISLDALKEELRLVAKQTHRAHPVENGKRVKARMFDGSLLPKHVVASSKVLQALLTNPEAYQWLMDRGVDELAQPEQTVLLAHLYHFRSTSPSGSSAAFIDSLDDPLLARMASSLLMEDPPEFHPEVIDDYLRIIRLHVLEQLMQATMQELLQSQVDGRDNVEELKRKVDQLQRELSEYRKMPTRNNVTG